MLLAVGTVLGSAVAAILVADAHESMAWASGRVARRAVALLPRHQRAVRAEEWAAELQSLGNMRLVKLAWSLGILAAALRMSFADKRAIARGDVPARGRLELRVHYAVAFEGHHGGRHRVSARRGDLIVIRHLSDLDNFAAELREQVIETYFEDGGREYVVPWYVPWSDDLRLPVWLAKDRRRRHGAGPAEDQGSDKDVR